MSAELPDLVYCCRARGQSAELAWGAGRTDAGGVARLVVLVTSADPNRPSR
jgi:hypothetical protein